MADYANDQTVEIRVSKSLKNPGREYYWRVDPTIEKYGGKFLGWVDAPKRPHEDNTPSYPVKYAKRTTPDARPPPTDFDKKFAELEAQIESLKAELHENLGSVVSICNELNDTIQAQMEVYSKCADALERLSK